MAGHRAHGRQEVLHLGRPQVPRQHRDDREPRQSWQVENSAFEQKISFVDPDPLWEDLDPLHETMKRIRYGSR